ncbi:DEAD/DEAH box helicase [Paracoccus sp. 08]|jgi:type III restriction enzyme|uniref:DEAD/DEAH box helicase n=1 Tax=Paracoccus sp. 08 TaxID=2606624 RepID=UPI002095B541|nr:DEAD/DEAH box helicase family protein [Paracoccus sp. 08]MCO6362497.1 DEAD/DEAH box helicase [Paracoccus sp. 08]
MKIELFDFQKDALHNLRKRLMLARPAASPEAPQAITLSAPTGSGKTIIMTALFEAILDQPDEQLDWPLDWVPQPDAVILWVSDMPELNEQTKLKIERQSDKVYRVGQLEVITASFDEERLAGGKIYFINTQKLASDRLLTTVGDGRSYSIWTTLTNTARAIPDRFYVVIDEAHRGMTTGKGSATAQTIIQQFIKGNKETGLVKMPLIIGVSATPKRFNELLADTDHTQHKVPVPVEDVKKSGLIKERVLIHHPANPTNAEMGILEEAARRWQVMTDQWASYCKDEGERPVRPILVIQIEDGAPTRTNLADAIKAVEDGIGRPLRDSELAHALMDKGGLKVGDRAIRYIDPSRIDDDADVSVVFFKMALSTGWDCPRAEVMMSFRSAQDHTYIAQLLGRMVRTPLARRIESTAELNDVHLYLPHFNAAAVEQVITALQTSDDIVPAETGEGTKLVTLHRRPGTESIFEAIEAVELVTYRVNAVRAQSDIRRYQAIASRLTMDGIDPNAWDDAKADAVSWIGEQVAVLKASGDFEKARKSLTKVGLRTVMVTGVTGMAEGQEDYTVDVSDLDVDRQFEDAGRTLGQGYGLHQLYRKANAERDGQEVKLEAIIVAASAAARSALENKSKAKFEALYDAHRHAISKLTEQVRAGYDKLKSASSTPSSTPWRLQDTIDFRRDTTEPTWSHHLYVEDDGSFRTTLNPWEADVLKLEMGRDDFVGWLRNLDRKPWSLEIPYQVSGTWKPMFPDMLIVRSKGADFVFDILEPHDDSRADNLYKAQGLAEFAEKHGDRFTRIQLIRKKGDGFVRLELNRTAVRSRVRQAASNPAIDAIFDELGMV